MFADIFKLISLRNNVPYIIFGGTIIVDEPICKKEESDESYTFTTDCIDNWVIKNVAEENANSDNNRKEEHINK